MGMTVDDTRTLIVQVSSLLSIFGSCLTALTTLFPLKNRHKMGKKLLFYLCVCDFGTALTYFVQTFDTDNSSSMTWCKTIALLGIFFPVASFLWTDLIGYYVYCIVMYRHSVQYNGEAWYAGQNGRANPRVMRWIHCLVWGTCGIIVLLVAATNSEGRQEHSSQWCWIKANPAGSEILWELIGGKFVEWTSCLVLLPYLYASAACKLVQLQTIDNDHERRPVGPQKPTSKLEAGGGGDDDKIYSHLLMNHNDQDDSADMRRSFISSNNSASTHQSGRTRTVSSSNNKTIFSRKFTAFYAKMAAVPALFLFARFWGSLRVILNSAYNHTDHDDDNSFLWLSYLQDAFDPAQGFFNAIVFVVCSSDGFNSIREAVTYVLIRCGFTGGLEGGSTAAKEKLLSEKVTSLMIPTEVSKHITGEADQYYCNVNSDGPDKNHFAGISTTPAAANANRSVPVNAHRNSRDRIRFGSDDDDDLDDDMDDLYGAEGDDDEVDLVPPAHESLSAVAYFRSLQDIDAYMGNEDNIIGASSSLNSGH
jgi:hypothetical protein